MEYTKIQNIYFEDGWGKKQNSEYFTSKEIFKLRGHLGTKFRVFYFEDIWKYLSSEDIWGKRYEVVA